MENNLNQQQATADQMYSYAANLMVNGNKNSYEVKMILIEKGINENDAAYIVNQLQDQIEDARQQKAKKDMLYGALWCVGGILVTAFTYSAASNGGGRYFVAWGAILFGGIQFVRGLVASTK